MNGDMRSLITLPFRNKSFLTAILYQEIGCSVCAFFLSNVAIAKIGVNWTSSFIDIATVVSIIAGALILKEAFSAFQTIRAVIIVIGVYTANSKEMLKNK
ncbi:MAG: EamA family transporter [Eubacteriales bacterium]|nr:EamA family transporter [Eubacteriales bacterium]